MKRFAKHLAKWLLIAIVAAIGVCYFVWSMHSIHRLIWLFVVVAIAAFVYRYMSEPDWKECKDKSGKKESVLMTKWEQLGMVCTMGIGCTILGALVWAVGYGVASVFEWNPDFWEMYLLYGAGSIAAVILVCYTIFKVWTFCGDLIHDRYFARDTAKSVLMWIAIVVLCLAVVGAILWFLFPIAIKF